VWRRLVKADDTGADDYGDKALGLVLEFLHAFGFRVVGGYARHTQSMNVCKQDSSVEGVQGEDVVVSLLRDLSPG
jgi:hypothetical protein